MSRIRILVTSLLIAAAVLQFAARASAEDIYDNISGSTGAVSGGSELISSVNAPIANSFSTGGSSSLLTDLGLLLLATNPASGNSFTVKLLSDASTSPGTALTTITTVNDSALTTTLATFNYQLPAPYPLAANTRYWIELTSGLTTSEWSYPVTNLGIGVANEYVYYAGTVYANSSFTPYQMTVTTAAVPEPATLSLCGLGLAALVAARRVLARAS